MTVDTVSASDASLWELALVWVGGRQESGELGASAAKNCRVQMRRFAGAHGDRPPAELDRVTFLEWEARLGGLKPAVQEASRATVTAFCSWLAATGHVEEDRIAGLRRRSVDAARTALGLLADDWLSGRAQRGEIVGRSRSVQASYLAPLVALHGNRPIRDLDRRTLLRVQERSGAQAAATRRHRLSAMKGFCRWLVVEGHLNSDPSVTLQKVRQPRSVPRALAGEDVAKVIAACGTSRHRAVVWLMVGCGLRCVEVARLDLHDYDPAGLTVQVRGKAGHERVLPVPDVVARALDSYVAARGHHQGPLIQADPRGRWSPTGNLGAHAVSEMVSHIMIAGGVHVPGDGRSAHALRHTAASDVLDACGDVRIVQEMLGHQSLATTQVYLRRADLGRLRVAMQGRDYPSTGWVPGPQRWWMQEEPAPRTQARLLEPLSLREHRAAGTRLEELIDEGHLIELAETAVLATSDHAEAFADSEASGVIEALHALRPFPMVAEEASPYRCSSCGTATVGSHARIVDRGELLWGSVGDADFRYCAACLQAMLGRLG